jgi:hypothetical protein
MRPYLISFLHSGLCEEVLLLDVLIRADLDSLVLCPDRLRPFEDVVPDLEDLLHRLGHGVLKEGARLEQGVL